MISMKALETLSGDISVYNDQVTYVLFEKLATIEGSVMFNASSLQSFEFPVLTTVGQDLNLRGLNEENTAAGSIASLKYRNWQVSEGLVRKQSCQTDFHELP